MEKPLVIDGIIGNGRLLVTLDRRGEVHHLFWPHIDRNQQVGRALAGLFLPGRREEVLWLSGRHWEHRQQYLGETAILRTTGVDPDKGVAFACTDCCVPGRALFLRRFRFVNQGLSSLHLVFLHYAALDLDGSPFLNACYYHPGAAALVYYRQRTVCAIGLNRKVTGYTCGRERTGGAALHDAHDGRLEGKAIEMGDVDACLASDLGVVAPGEAAEVDVFWSWASDRREALAGLEEARRTGAEALCAETASYWANWLARGETGPSGDETLDRLFRRSLITLKLLSDAEHGGLIAAPETDPAFTGSGGYGYCWGRDAAWVSTAFDEAGHPEEATAFYRWAKAAQEPDGCWYQRYFCDASLAPSWGLVQGDETASVVFGVFHHFALTRDRAFLAELWPTVQRAVEYLRRTLDRQTGLPGPSIDLWEERFQESAYTAASVYGAFTGAAYLAREMGRPAEAALYEAEAGQVQKAILNRLWHPPDGRFLRGLAPREGRGEAEVLDRGLDASLLGLAVPFGAVAPRDPRMRATAGQIARYLENPRVGGIHRYAGDAYRGGNPWVVCTLWLGLYELACGEPERALARLVWAAEHRTGLDLLPEQVDGETGCPSWVIPLGWSHALYVHLLLALRPRGVF